MFQCIPNSSFPLPLLEAPGNLSLSSLEEPGPAPAGQTGTSEEHPDDGSPKTLSLSLVSPPPNWYMEVCACGFLLWEVMALWTCLSPLQFGGQSLAPSYHFCEESRRIVHSFSLLRFLLVVRMELLLSASRQDQNQVF